VVLNFGMLYYSIIRSNSDSARVVTYIPNEIILRSRFAAVDGVAVSTYGIHTRAMLLVLITKKQLVNSSSPNFLCIPPINSSMRGLSIFSSEFKCMMGWRSLEDSRESAMWVVGHVRK